jgi:hypothetical protein
LEATPFARVSKWLSLEAVPFGVPLERALSEAITGQAQTAQMIRSIAEGDGKCHDKGQEFCHRLIDLIVGELL